MLNYHLGSHDQPEVAQQAKGYGFGLKHRVRELLRAFWCCHDYDLAAAARAVMPGVHNYCCHTWQFSLWCAPACSRTEVLEHVNQIDRRGNDRFGPRSRLAFANVPGRAGRKTGHESLLAKHAARVQVGLWRARGELPERLMAKDPNDDSE